MIFRLDDDSWLLYSTGKRGRFGAVSVCVSENLLDWRFVRFALVTTPEAPYQPPWGATESPFVFWHDGAYWLSITYTRSFGGPAEYHDTLLFRSPTRSTSAATRDGQREVAAHLYAHAPEYLRDPDSGRGRSPVRLAGRLFGTVIPGRSRSGSSSGNRRA